MDKIDDGGPAFPCPEASLVHFNYPQAYMGLTIRDYFAAAALQAIITQRHGLVGANHAQEAYKAADAMLTTRKKA